MNDSIYQTLWQPTKYIRCLETNADERITADEKYAIIVLNRPVTAPNFAQLWNEGKDLRLTTL